MRTRLYLAQRYPFPGSLAVNRRPLCKSTLATCRTAEFGFFGVIVTTRETMPLACGHRMSMDVRDIVGFLYFSAGFNLKRLRRADCLHVAIHTKD
jgi:hypothetical protein